MLQTDGWLIVGPGGSANYSGLKLTVNGVGVRDVCVAGPSSAAPGWRYLICPD